MRLLIRILLPLLIVGGAAFWAWYLVKTKPEPRTFPAPPEVTQVEATRLKPQSFQVNLDTQGTVQPRTTTTLLPEVSGRVIHVAENFRDGGFFLKKDVLLEIDPLNYETALAISKSNEAQALSALREEEIRGQQALENWKRLGKSGEPSEMVIRGPQLAQAQANYDAAKAEVKKAERDLERTKVQAPYNGRIMEQMADVGQFVTTGTQLARVFETDVMEVRLPLTNKQLAFIDLPEPSFAEDGEEKETDKKKPRVVLRGRIGNRESQWKGEVIRVDSAIDEVSRQLFVVAEVHDPYHREEGSDPDGSPLKIGMYLEGIVEGVELHDVFILPRKAVRVGGEVIVIGENNKIRRQQVEPIWSERDKVIIPGDGAGLKEGDVVCLTPLAYPANGALVLPTIDGVTPEVEFPGSGHGFAGKGKGKGKGGKEKSDEKEKTASTEGGQDNS